MPSKSDDALLAQYDASQASMEELDLRENVSARYSRVGRSMAVHWVLHAICFVILTLALVFQIAEPSLARCWKLYHYYSPADEAVIHAPWVETRFKGSLWHRSPFKGPPTPEVEEAWQSAMKYGMIAVTAEDILQVGHNLTAVQFPPSVGGGYMAATVGTHQLHCLHFIWQDHHRGSFSDVRQKIADLPELYEQHYEHCVDYIRQGVMCHFDTGIIPYNWIHDYNNPTPNSNTMHKCLDWEILQDWLRSRAVEMPEGFVWRQPDDAVSLEWNL